jgi:hypothetical protein
MKNRDVNLPLDFCRLTKVSGPKSRSVFQFSRFARSLANIFHFRPPFFDLKFFRNLM